MNQNPIKIAVIGCGTMAEKLHLPLLSRRRDCLINLLVDADAFNLKQMAEQYGISNISTDYKDVSKYDISAAIVAVPNFLHADVGCFLMEKGIHVYMEKPLACNLMECDRMLKTAKKNDVVLAVGFIRRFFHAGHFTHQVIRNKLLGRILSFDIREGSVFSWPIKSDALLNREKSGGGVLLDLGSHTLDQLIWWLGDIAEAEYYDDNYGGVESECLIQLTTNSGISGEIELSRTRDLRGTAIISGEKGELEVSLMKNSAVLRFPGEKAELRGELNHDQRSTDLMEQAHNDFFRAIRNGSIPLANGFEARRSLAVIDKCYESRQALQLPWVTQINEMTMARA